jgi:hypothetical protein
VLRQRQAAGARGLVTAILSVVIVAASLAVCVRLVADSRANQRDKNDLAELNHVKYGLFSVDEWKRQIAAILAEEIEKLHLSSTNEQDLRKHIEVQLATLIDEVDRRVRKENAGSAGGWVKQSFINLFVSMEEVKKGIPDYADAIFRELTKAKTTAHVKAMLAERIERYAGAKYDAAAGDHRGRILRRTGATDVAGARSVLAAQAAATQHRIARDAILLIVLASALFVAAALERRPPTPLRYLGLVLSLALLLAAGVTTPTIDVEAKIAQMSFVLMGHSLHFENQVLYFQSKSIVDVFWIMVTNEGLPMKLVGALLVTFSIVFPVLKLVTSLGYHAGYRQARGNRLVRFFVLKSGKWSMADVMVVAIFMAYIGFNGIISSQFVQLDTAGPELVILTTNGTSLQPGYYLFVAYTLLALLLPGFLRAPEEG